MIDLFLGAALQLLLFLFCTFLSLCRAGLQAFLDAVGDSFRVLSSNFVTRDGTLKIGPSDSNNHAGNKGYGSLSHDIVSYVYQTNPVPVHNHFLWWLCHCHNLVHYWPPKLKEIFITFHRR